MARCRPWATSTPTPFPGSPLPRQINVLQAKKKFEILDSVSAWRGVGGGTALEHGPGQRGCPAGGLTCASRLQMLSFMHAQYSFFQQGYSLLHQLDPYMKKLAAEVSLGEGRGRAQPGSWGEGSLPSLTPLPTAGPAGDRLGRGEAGDGAQARGHPAAGEAPTALHWGLGVRGAPHPADLGGPWHIQTLRPSPQACSLCWDPHP